MKTLGELIKFYVDLFMEIENYKDFVDLKEKLETLNINFNYSDVFEEYHISEKTENNKQISNCRIIISKSVFSDGGHIYSIRILNGFMGIVHLENRKLKKGLN